MTADSTSTINRTRKTRYFLFGNIHYHHAWAFTVTSTMNIHPPSSNPRKNISNDDKDELIKPSQRSFSFPTQIQYRSLESLTLASRSKKNASIYLPCHERIARLTPDIHDMNVDSLSIAMFQKDPNMKSPPKQPQRIPSATKTFSSSSSSDLTSITSNTSFPPSATTTTTSTPTPFRSYSNINDVPNGIFHKKDNVDFTMEENAMHQQFSDSEDANIDPNIEWVDKYSKLLFAPNTIPKSMRWLQSSPSRRQYDIDIAYPVRFHGDIAPLQPYRCSSSPTATSFGEDITVVELDELVNNLGQQRIAENVYPRSIGENILHCMPLEKQQQLQRPPSCSDYNYF
jgi:hypothetical protein